MKRNDVKDVIDRILIPYFDCFDWKEFSKNKPMFEISHNKLDSDKAEIAETTGSVMLEMERGSIRATILGKKLAGEFNVKYVTYPYLVKMVTRVLAGSTVDEIEEMAKLSNYVQAKINTRDSHIFLPLMNFLHNKKLAENYIELQ